MKVSVIKRIVYALCVVIAVALPMVGAELKVTSIEAIPNDLTARVQPVQDLNGNLCALIKIQMPKSDCAFDGNVLKSEYSVNEYRVYMSPGTKELQLRYPGKQTLSIDFRDLTDNRGLESGVTYSVAVTGFDLPAGSKGDGANGSYLVLDITPKTGVIVEVDGKLLAVEDGQASTFLGYGNHTYTVRAKGYETATGTAQISKGTNTKVPVTLVSTIGELTFDVSPRSDAVVEIAGEFIPVSNGKASISLEYGDYPYSVKAGGYDTFTGTAQVTRGKNTTVPVNLVSNMATLTVKTQPAGAKIKINGKEKGTGTFSESLAPGTYLIEVEKPSHTSWSESVVLAERDNKTLTVPALQPIYGSLNIDYKPIGSTVIIDGQEVGTTPAMIGDLLIGPHSVEISKDKYDTSSFLVSISEAETTNLTGTLKAVTTNLTGALEAETTNLTGALSETSEIELIPSYKNGKYGYINQYGKEVIPFKYDRAYRFSKGMAKVMLNGKYGYIDKTGKEVIPFKYDNAWDFSEGLAAVEQNGKYGYIDKTGKEVIPFKYDLISSFSEGVAAVKLNWKYGYIDKTGKEVIPFKYDVAWNFKNGKARVVLNERKFYIDKNGNEVK